MELFEFKDDGQGGPWTEGDKALVQTAIDAIDADLRARLEQESIRRGRSIRLYMIMPDPTFSAFAMPVGTISFSTKLRGTPYFTSVAAHEIGHIADAWLLDNAQRAELKRIMCRHNPMHEWGKTTEPYFLHVREALAELLAEFYGFGGLPFWYEHSDGLTGTQRIEVKAFMDAVIIVPQTKQEAVAEMQAWAAQETSSQSFLDAAPVVYNFALKEGKRPLAVYQEMHRIAQGGIWQELAREVAERL